MARIRSLKHDLFIDDELCCACSICARYLFMGMLTIADRAGRLEDRPARIKALVLPYDDGVNVEALLAELEAGRYILRYVAGDKRVIQIRQFSKHQRPHPKEPPSTLPMYTEPCNYTAEPGKVTAEPLKVPDEPVSNGVWGVGCGVLGVGDGVKKKDSCSSAAPPSEFEQFWTAYPRKVGKGRARKAWTAAAKRRPPLAEILAKIEAQAGSDKWREEGGKYIPHPTTWIHREGWDDEVEGETSYEYPEGWVNGIPPSDLRNPNHPHSPLRDGLWHVTGERWSSTLGKWVPAAEWEPLDAAS